MFDSLIAAGNSFQNVGEEKLKERLPKLVVQKGIDRGLEDSDWLSGDIAKVGKCEEDFFIVVPIWQQWVSKG